MELPSVVSSYLDAYNRFDVETMLNCVSEDVVFENISNSGSSLRIEGKGSFAELARQAADAFSHRKQSVRNSVSAGGEVALEIEWEGTPRFDMGDFQAGVQASLRGASFMTISNGKLSRIADLS
jgi:steroid delta-isomerase-like uncharacterized protein